MPTPRAAVPAVLDAHALHWLLADLEPVCTLSLAANERALPTEPRVPSTARTDPLRSVDDLSERGIAAAARAVYYRLARVPWGAQPVLVWLMARARARPTPEALALELALERGPVALREALTRATLAREAADRAVTLATPKQGRAITVTLARARDAQRGCQAREEAARAPLVDWGTAALTAAWRAWQRAGT